MLPLMLTEEWGRNKVERAAFWLNVPFYVWSRQQSSTEPQDQSATAAPSNMTAERHVRSTLAINFNIHSISSSSPFKALFTIPSIIEHVPSFNVPALVFAWNSSSTH
eukprot:5533922-Amphidinium_carterae.1